MSLYILYTSQMIYHRGASLSEHCIADCHGTEAMEFVTVCCSGTMMSVETILRATISSVNEATKATHTL